MKQRVRVYRRGYLWYAACPLCPDRLRSPFLPNVHTIAMRHVQGHRTEQEATR